MACSSSFQLRLRGSLLLRLPPSSLMSPAVQTQIAYGRSGGGSGGRPVTRRSCAYMEDLRLGLNENPSGVISGEWPENFSLLSYDDLRAYLQAQIFEDHKMKPSPALAEVMSTPIQAATADQTLAEIEGHFEVVSGLPVVDNKFRCIGMISKKDTAKAQYHGLKSKVGEVMSSPAITLSHEKTAMDAAALMLKMKIHRIPIVNEKRQVIGIVTRTDIFEALESLEV